MLSLTRHGVEVGSVFAMPGTEQGADPAAALGFALSRCPKLATALASRIARTAGMRLKMGQELVLAVHGGDGGLADLEIRHGMTAFVVQPTDGWQVPSAGRLARGARRVAAGGGTGALVSLSNASQSLARHGLPADVGGVPVVHLQWADVAAEVDQLKSAVRGMRDRVFLEEFRTYVVEVMRVRRCEDSWTLCVVLNNESPGGTATLKEIVTEQSRFFHPYAVRGWPTEPPNFLAFRWDGAVRRIHRVVAYEVVADLSERWPEMTGPTTARPHVVYQLGPRLPPHEPIANGQLHVTARLWVLLDQLQTSPTLAQAVARSKELSGS